MIANGDIDSVAKAMHVLQQTGADAIMIGCGAQGNPWLFREIDYFMRYGQTLAKPGLLEIYQVLASHLEKLYSFYGDVMGVRIARKHIGWYFQYLETIGQQTKDTINQGKCLANSSSWCCLWYSTI